MYRKIIKHLRMLNANFHTFQLKQERAFYFILRNIHHSVNQDEPKSEFSKLGHEVINISNIKHSITKNPLSLFYIDLKQKANDKEVYNISSLMNSIVKIEPPYKKREIVQCKRCKRYGRTQKYCNRVYYCVKCFNPHPISQSNELAGTPAKCVHCKGNYSASCRGCLVYKELYNKRFLEPKIIDTTNHPRNAHNHTTLSTSYTQAVRKNQNMIYVTK